MSSSLAKEITACRLCGNPALSEVIDLGAQSLSGLFPHPEDPPVPREKLQLVRCLPEGDLHCGLVQLRHSCDPGTMYGSAYGYRSALNPSMVRHLRSIVERLLEQVSLRPDDLVIDIGSNDGTLLSFHELGSATLLGVDPTAAKFRKYYREDIEVIEDFFSAGRVRERFPGAKARLITSIAMIYDLEEPLRFVREIAGILAPDGLWFFEQSHLPAMLEANAYDTICHEHLEYYGLSQLKYMLDRAGLRMIAAEPNDTNGGSIAVTACHVDAAFETDSAVDKLLRKEEDLHLLEQSTWDAFRARVEGHRDELRATITSLKDEGLSVYGYGASTKGNVLLQYCGLGPSDIIAIGEVNADKFGCVTPGTGIPIVDESLVRERKPDVLVVLPWHFREFIISKEENYLNGGGRLLFPLPSVELIKR